LRIVKLFQDLQSEKKEYMLSKQLLRSGYRYWCIGSRGRTGRKQADFIHKMAIAQKEANESDYWVDLLFQSDYLDELTFNSIKQDLKRF